MMSNEKVYEKARQLREQIATAVFLFPIERPDFGRSSRR